VRRGGGKRGEASSLEIPNKRRNMGVKWKKNGKKKTVYGGATPKHIGGGTTSGHAAKKETTSAVNSNR